MGIDRRTLLAAAGLTGVGAHVAHAAGGMVACADPQAAAAGAQMLTRGGTAADAAVAAALALSVVEPHASGLGGGGVGLVWRQADRAAVALDGLSGAPAIVPPTLRTAPDGSRIPLSELEGEGRVVAVPGAPRLLQVLWRDAGRLAWADLAGPAITLAETGFGVSPTLSNAIRVNPRLHTSAPFRAIYLPGGRIPAAGTRLRNADHGLMLRRYAAGGSPALMQGPFATALLQVTRTATWPGMLRAADLAAHRTLTRTVREARVFGRRCLTVGAPCAGGIAALATLGLLERWGAGGLEPTSLAQAHRMIEAGRLCAADRVAWMGDPRYGAVPDAGLIDPAYLDARANLLIPVRARATYPAGRPPGSAGVASERDEDAGARTGTSHICTFDAAGNAVSLTMTVNKAWGSGLLARGIVLNDGLNNFTESAVAHPNRIAPNKRPATTMAPLLVLNASNNILFVLGSAGGARIIDGTVRTLAGLLVWRQRAVQAVALPHISGAGGLVELEAETPAAALAPRLQAMGHAPTVLRMSTGTHLITSSNGVLVGAADPRRSGDVVPA